MARSHDAPSSETRIGISFTEHIAESQHRLSPAARGELTSLLLHLMMAAKIISRETRQAALIDNLGLTGRTNVQGEEVQKLDEYADDIIIRNLRYTGHLNGTVYGSPVKHRDGTTPVRNLFICGTDQGFLGIVGAMLSGISIANLHLLRN